MGRREWTDPVRFRWVRASKHPVNEIVGVAVGMGAERKAVQKEFHNWVALSLTDVGTQDVIAWKRERPRGTIEGPVD